MVTVHETIELEDSKQDSKANASVVLGITGLVALLVPGVGLPLSVAGIVLGKIGLKSPRGNNAKVGLVLSSFGLFLTVVAMSVISWGLLTESVSWDGVLTFIGGRAAIMAVGIMGVIQAIYPWARRPLWRDPRRNALQWGIVAASFVFMMVIFLKREEWEVALVCAVAVVYFMVWIAIALRTSVAGQ
jgi:hypothetical protein